MNRHQIALFTFTLGSRESIGPSALREMWIRACGSRNASVGRREPLGGHRDRPVYMLYAEQNLANLREVELEMRRLLEAEHLNASMTALHA